MDTIISDLSIQSTGLANKAYQPGDDTAVDGLVTAPAVNDRIPKPSPKTRVFQPSALALGS